MKKNIYISAAIFSVLTANAQEDPAKPIGTQEVEVTSSYRPKVQDAFKINDNPLIEDQEVSEKRTVKYNIFSFPVESTFTPEKGEAATVDKDSVANYLNNYALLGYGNYNTLLAELGVVESIGKNMYLGGLIKHRSSGGGIDNVPVDDKYSRSQLDILLGNKSDRSDWNIKFGTELSTYNWYGFPIDYIDLSTVDFNALDVQQKYQNLNIGGNFNFYNGPIENIETKYIYFWDQFDSKESRFYFKPKFNLEFPNQTVHVNLIADYVNTQFSDDRINNQDHQFSYLILAGEPSVKFLKDNYSVELGAGIGYINGDAKGEKDNSVLVYPKIKANIDLVPDIVLAYMGADGGVVQNSYHQFSIDNPYISPDLELMPTKVNFDIYAGLKGKLYHNISYNIKGSYKSEDQKALFTPNVFNHSLASREGYEYGNSYRVIYDQVKTFSGFGELTFDFEDVNIDLYGQYNAYSLDKSVVAYNLPEATFGLKAHVNITPKVFAGAHLYYVSQREDIVQELSAANLLTNHEVLLESYADLNLNLGYKPNDYWTVFLKAHNIFNQDYKFVTNYQVQGFQLLAGLMYKFDLKKHNN